MSQPPNSNEPPEEPPGIQEPPRKKGDTQPFKVRRVKPPAGRAGQPPATVLREAGEPGLADRAGKPALPEDRETAQVRLLPRVPNPPCWRVIFQAASPSGATIGLDVRHSLVVGRANPGADEQPDLDLSPHQAAEHGVSRRHAELIPTEEALYLLDLDSTNGTWLNGSYLKPGQRRTLSPGDRVELGLLGLVVRSISRISR
jgi:hypothetical protein